MESKTKECSKRQLNVLIVEDDLTGRRLIQKFLSSYGDCDISVDGKEALLAFRLAWEKEEPYDLICLDVMMPRMDGQDVLKSIRAWEQKRGILLGQGVKIIMTTALDDAKNVLNAFKAGSEAYIVKPIEKEKLLSEIRKLGLIE